MRDTFAACVLLGFLLTCSATEVTWEPKDCYANKSNPYIMLGRKTAYEFVYERPKPGDGHITDCEPVQLWLLARHGSRYPANRTIKTLHSLEDLKQQILLNHEEEHRGRLCHQDLENLKAWTLNLTIADSKSLTEEGKNELKFLARRLRDKYPSLFQRKYEQILYEFRHTKHERTRQSAQSFAEGLFGTETEVWIPPGLQNDTVILAFTNCTYWLRNVEKSAETTRERDLFVKGPYMTAVRFNVSQRLGFLQDLPEETILNMYEMCRFNKAWAVKELSPWCAVFTQDELKVLEYWNDLENYYDSSYGNEWNVRLGCPPLKDMLQRFEQLASNTGHQPAGVFYFTHRKALLMMLSRMGLFSKGPPLRHNDYHRDYSHEWRISNISPFAANLAAVFFKCSTGECNRVVFFLNEKRIDYEGCEAGLCSWSYIRNRFRDVLQHCNLDWCHNDSSRTAASIPLISAVYFIFYIATSATVRNINQHFLRLRMDAYQDVGVFKSFDD